MLRVFPPRDEDEEEEAKTSSAHQTPPDSKKSTISIYEEGSGPDSENPKFSKEVLEVARKVYDENRMYVSVGQGMKDNCCRNGLLLKKIADESGRIRMHGSRNYYREYDMFPPTMLAATTVLTLQVSVRRHPMARGSFIATIPILVLSCVPRSSIHRIGRPSSIATKRSVSIL
jgi:hypothetical protein